MITNGLIGEYDRLRRRVPVLLGLCLVLLVGMFGSIAFGLQGSFEEVVWADEQTGPASLG